MSPVNTDRVPSGTDSRDIVVTDDRGFRVSLSTPANAAGIRAELESSSPCIRPPNASPEP